MHCDFTAVECPQCQGAFQKNHLKEHMTQECPRRQVCCPNCATSMAYEDKEVLGRSLSASIHMGLLMNVTSWSCRKKESFGIEDLFELHRVEALNTRALIWEPCGVKRCLTVVAFWPWHQRGQYLLAK